MVSKEFFNARIIIVGNVGKILLHFIFKLLAECNLRALLGRLKELRKCREIREITNKLSEMNVYYNYNSI